MQSGWNPVLKHVKAKIPTWVSNKNGKGTVDVKYTASKISILAKNQVSSVRQIKDIQRRIDWVSRIYKKRVERDAVKQAKPVLERMFA